MTNTRTVADSALTFLKVADKEYGDTARGAQPSTRENMVALGDAVAAADVKSAKAHTWAAIPLFGVAVDAQVMSRTLDGYAASDRTRLGKVLSLSVNAGGWIAAIAFGEPLLMLGGTAYHLLLAGVDAAQAGLHRVVARHAALPQ